MGREEEGGVVEEEEEGGGAPWEGEEAVFSPLREW